ncbi:MAG: DUF697 domain-containing protein [Acidobacteriota bacterium]
MRSTLRRILAVGAGFLSVAFTVILVNQTLQLADFAGRLHPVAGDVVLWGLVLLYLAGLGVPLYLYFRLPRALVPPDVVEGPAFEEHLRRVADRLRRNPRLEAGVLETREQIESALAALDAEANEVVRAAGSRAFLTTAVSQNGALDALLVLGIQSKLVWDVAHVYAQRPSLRDMGYLYANVLTTAFVAGELDDADLSAAVQPVLSTVLGSAASAVPGLQGASTIFVNSVLSGTANAFLTLRVGIIAQEYSHALTQPAKPALRRTAVARAAAMLGSIVSSGAGRVSGAIARASGRTFTGALSGVGRRFREAGDAVADRFPFGPKKPAPQDGD